MKDVGCPECNRAPGMGHALGCSRMHIPNRPKARREQGPVTRKHRDRTKYHRPSSRPGETNQ